MGPLVAGRDRRDRGRDPEDPQGRKGTEKGTQGKTRGEPRGDAWIASLGGVLALAPAATAPTNRRPCFAWLNWTGWGPGARAKERNE